VPLLTTPEISLQQFSPNPVGASNATTGLIAGATNATLSQIQGSTSSVYTVPVWYQGGAPLITAEVRLYPETVGREGHPMHVAMDKERRHEEVREELREERRHVERSHAERSHAEAEEEKREEARASWTYLTGPSPAAAANESKGVRKSGHVYTNDDVTRQNDKNGAVKYDGKKEKI
jgi:hypothetical protein